MTFPITSLLNQCIKRTFGWQAGHFNIQTGMVFECGTGTAFSGVFANHKWNVVVWRRISCDPSSEVQVSSRLLGSWAVPGTVGHIPSESEPTRPHSCLMSCSQPVCWGMVVGGFVTLVEKHTLWLSKSQQWAAWTYADDSYILQFIFSVSLRIASYTEIDT